MHIGEKSNKCNQCDYASSLAGDLRIMCIFWFVATQFKIWSLGDVSCIGSKVDYQDESLTLPLCLVMPYWHYHLVLGWYLYQSESYQLSFKSLSHSLTYRQTDRQTSGPIDRTPGTPGSDKNCNGSAICCWKKVGKVARIGGWVGLGNARI